MASLVLGPILRYVSETQATIWLETDGPCEAEILGHRERTFCIEGHHFALIVLDGLEPGCVLPYEVLLDGMPVPTAGAEGWPPPLLRTLPAEGELRIAFGSCRVAAPHEPPWTLSHEQAPEGREICALYALAHRMRGAPPAEWPHLLLMLGDQVYVDEDAPATRAFIRARRDTAQPPHEGVLGFEEYARLYRESWGGDAMRWLLANLPSGMIFDDHDVHDDWNTSAAWVAEMERLPWWHERIESALMSYWTYQDLGNRSPAELAEDELLARVKAAGDAGPLLREHARDWDHARNGSRWSWARRLGNAKLVVFDSREGRILDEGDRRMFDDKEWEFIEREACEPCDHLLLADTLPVLMPEAFHHVESWNEAVCAGAWGRAGKWLAGERLRRAMDLEHWAAFDHGFRRLMGLIGEVARGERGEAAPATVTMLAGDIHHAYLAEAELPGGTRSKVSQAVCSPFRNPLSRRERALARIGCTRGAARVGRALARLAGVDAPPVRWRLVERPTFDNQVATITLDGPRASLRIERTSPGDGSAPELTTTLARRLS